MAADQCPNIHLDTSSSNSWMKYHPGLTLEAVFRQALAVAGPERLLFGTDSSFFPRGWQKPVYDAQVAALDAAGVGARRSRDDPGRQFRAAVSRQSDCTDRARVAARFVGLIAAAHRRR